MELEVLKAIEEKLPLRIPVRDFFDLIVGTRFVYEIFFWRQVNLDRMLSLFYI